MLDLSENNSSQKNAEAQCCDCGLSYNPATNPLSVAHPPCWMLTPSPASCFCVCWSSCGSSQSSIQSQSLCFARTSYRLVFPALVVVVGVQLDVSEWDVCWITSDVFTVRLALFWLAGWVKQALLSSVWSGSGLSAICSQLYDGLLISLCQNHSQSCSLLFLLGDTFYLVTGSSVSETPYLTQISPCAHFVLYFLITVELTNDSCLFIGFAVLSVGMSSLRYV